MNAKEKNHKLIQEALEFADKYCQNYQEKEFKDDLIRLVTSVFTHGAESEDESFYPNEPTVN